MFPITPDYGQFPFSKTTDEQLNSPQYRELRYKLALQHIAAVLKSGYPLGLEPVCGRRADDGTCVGMHGVVVNGYERRCKKSNPNDCKVLLKITNSWGEAWQRQNDDGWVDAEEIFRLWREEKEDGVLSWIHEPTPEPEKLPWMKLERL